MLVCYSSKIAAWALARSPDAKSALLAARFTKLSSTISEGRMLSVSFTRSFVLSPPNLFFRSWRFWGVLPLIQLWRTLSRESSGSGKKSTPVLLLEKAQCLLLLAYYPLEHACLSCPSASSFSTR
jgi:hypothetical protein